MKALLVVIAAFAVQAVASGQRVAQRLGERIPNCYEIGYNFQRLVPEMYASEDYDSLKIAMNYYLENCPATEHYMQFELLWNIKRGGFSPNEYPDLFGLMMSYQESITTTPIVWDHPYSSRQAWLKVYRDYYSFLQQMAAEELATGVYEGLERELLRFYSGDIEEVMRSLRKGQYPHQDLQRQFNQRLDQMVLANEFYFAVYGGAWIPDDNLARLGNHPEIGVKLGGYTNKMHYDLVLGFRFVDAPQPYRVRRNDSIYTDDFFTGVYIGVETSRSIYRSLRSNVDIGAGIAYDGINYLPYDAATETGPETINSINLNLGAGYSYYYNFKDYVRVEARYNFLSYNNGINNELAGNAVSLRLLWGFTENSRKRSFAEIAGY